VSGKLDYIGKVQGKSRKTLLVIRLDPFKKKNVRKSIRLGIQNELSKCRFLLLLLLKFASILQCYFRFLKKFFKSGSDLELL
jgi:hypothetical protein